ncbi:MAG: hypothetical protein JWO31_3853, partial [Phycisphaerales bacterium]|nr:hypothetical protein [Phycisphaerales bacterium]
MVRTILLMLGVLAASAGGFYVYVRTQAPAPRATKTVAPPPPQPIDRDAGTAGSMGPGDKPWVKVFDSDKKLSYQFRAGGYEPQHNGPINVADVTAEFFQYVKLSRDPADKRTRTQKVQITGKTGTVEIQQGPRATADKGMDRGGSGGPPKRGLLNDVVIRVFPTLAATRPTVTVVTPNAAFDNESFEISTKAYTAPDGTVVPADQVPVTATGDYEFKGRGLTLRWNDLDGRLELLEIAHGEYLYIKDPDGLRRGGPLGGDADAPPA